MERKVYGLSLDEFNLTLYMYEGSNYEFVGWLWMVQVPMNEEVNNLRKLWILRMIINRMIMNEIHLDYVCVNPGRYDKGRGVEFGETRK